MGGVVLCSVWFAFAMREYTASQASCCALNRSVSLKDTVAVQWCCYKLMAKSAAGALKHLPDANFVW